MQSFLAMRNSLALSQENSFVPDQWLASQRRFPASPFFIKPAYVRESLEFTGLAKDLRPWFLRTAAAVSKRRDLRRLAWHLHFVLFLSGRSPKWPGPWTGLSAPLGDLAPMFPALVLLSGLPQLRARYRALGLPGEVLRHTLSDIEIWIRDYQAKQGRPGFANVGWLMNHFQARLFRLGRLQYMRKDFDGGVRMYEEKGRGRRLLMSLPGIRYRADGWVDGSNYTHENPKQAWISSQGHLISEAGFAIRRKVSLAKAAWRQVLAPGDPVLDLHIAAGEPMRLEDCRASLRQADAFFARHFPKQPYKAKMCWSWLLDPTFQKMLPAGSNIRAFQSLFHIYPVLCADNDIFARVFAPYPFNPARMPRDTSLRRAILGFMDRGGQFLGAGGGILRPGN